MKTGTMRCLLRLGLLGTTATFRRGRALVEGGPDSTESPERAVVECGDSSPLLRRRLVAIKLPSASEPAGVPALARGVDAPMRTHISPSLTATSRLGKAVTSHRTPKPAAIQSPLDRAEITVVMRNSPSPFGSLQPSYLR